MAHVWMSHTAHMWMSHGTLMNESCLTQQWQPLMGKGLICRERHGAHMNESHGTHMNDSRHSCEWVMSHTPVAALNGWRLTCWERHGTHMSESHGTHMNKSWLIQEWRQWLIHRFSASRSQIHILTHALGERLLWNTRAHLLKWFSVNSLVRDRFPASRSEKHTLTHEVCSRRTSLWSKRIHLK